MPANNGPPSESGSAQTDSLALAVQTQPSTSKKDRKRLLYVREALQSIREVSCKGDWVLTNLRFGNSVSGRSDDRFLESLFIRSILSESLPRLLKDLSNIPSVDGVGKHDTKLGLLVDPSYNGKDIRIKFGDSFALGFFTVQSFGIWPSAVRLIPERQRLEVFRAVLRGLLIHLLIYQQGAERAPLADRFSGCTMYLASLIHLAALDPEGCRNVELNESIHIGGEKHGESKPSLLSAFKWLRRQGTGCSDEVQRLMEGLRFILGFPPTNLLEKAGLSPFEVACAAKSPDLRMQLAASWIDRNPLFLTSSRVGCAGCGRIAEGTEASRFKICMACRCVAYCGRPCQLRVLRSRLDYHEGGHRQYCSRMITREEVENTREEVEKVDKGKRVAAVIS